MTDMMNAYCRIILRGRVQGVGFRWFVKQHADQLGINGYVKNLHNGDVEIEAEGEKSRVEDLIDEVKKGPTFAKVQDIEVEWKDYSGRYGSFYIAY